MKLPELNQRVLDIIDYKSNGNVKKFSELINISQQKVNRLFNVDTRTGNYPNVPSDILTSITELFVDIDSVWLLTGKGVMISNNIIGINEEIKKPEADPKQIQLKEEFNLRSDSRKEIQFIPLYNLEAAAGLVPLFNDAAKPVPLDYISIPNLPKCDGAIYVVGDSMYPLLKSGDIVLYKQVHDIANGIFYGEMYLLSLDMSGEEYVVVKYIQKSDIPDHVRLVSYNSHHSEKDVLISSIRALAFVKASIRINSMI